MRDLIKDILKEETNSKNQKKGIDIVVKMMRKSHPYIIGWKYNEELAETAVSIYIDVICDVEKTKEFFNFMLNSNIKKKIISLSVRDA